ncbi:MAG TPA: hypothetical protein VME23_06610 [Terracidiphilus sp.]|nr:hypothetical protein [Terracidiphilus sp.]
MEEAERQEKLATIERPVELAEKAYDKMYDVYEQHDINDCYRDAKEYYYDAIGLARELGMNEEADKLHERLFHIKQVFFGQVAR